MYWSHRLSRWSDLWRPEGNFQPQYDLAWRRFQAELVTEFIGWQAGIVREVTGGRGFVTTCISYEQPGVEDVELSRALDVASGNAYYEMQDSLAHPNTLPRSSRPDGLGRPRAVGGHPARGPDVLLQAGAVPGHRDQRRLDRLLVHERVALRRPVAPAGLAARRARGAAHRVLALEHPAVRRRDVLGRRASAQRHPRPRLPRDRADRPGTARRRRRLRRRRARLRHRGALRLRQQVRAVDAGPAAG